MIAPKGREAYGALPHHRRKKDPIRGEAGMWTLPKVLLVGGYQAVPNGEANKAGQVVDI